MPPPEACSSICPTLIRAWPRSRTNIAYTDQPHAAVMPSDTSVSIEAEACRALRSAAAWNGHADQMTTGAAVRTRIHCHPGKRDHGNSDHSTDRSLSGMKNTSATISRFRRSRTRAASGPGPAAPACPAPAVSWSGTSAWYPAAVTASMSRCTGTDSGAVTRARPVAKFTVARDVIEGIELLLHPGRARRAGHPADREAHLPRRRRCAVSNRRR